ncbi:glycosyltransferase family 2 protein, partial [Alloacidobacterium sp.]|uniref:glycosyltransferase family 2 protein n=1 Tax=Alloacidobacterium sp. TaxID=2951999 RepID=UPI002D3BE533
QRLAIVVPCYNEEEVLPETASCLESLIQELIAAGLVREVSLYFIDDGSTDRTWDLIEVMAAGDSRVHGIKLSRNYGHQSALLAGLMNAEGDAVISIDADLQDDLSAMKDMLAAYSSGAEIVYGIRRERSADTLFKRGTAEGYYRLLQTIGVRLVFNHADYRLLSRRVIEALRDYKEANLFLRGLIPQLGFNSATVYYDRQERFAGESKYPFSKMLGLAIEGVTSFSEVPLKLITVLGILISLVSFGLALWALGVRILNPAAVPGWASIVIPLYFLGGIQLLCMGVIGIYLAKVYSEAKGRPRFIVEKTL